MTFEFDFLGSFQQQQAPQYQHTHLIKAHLTALIPMKARSLFLLTAHIPRVMDEQMGL